MLLNANKHKRKFAIPSLIAILLQVFTPLNTFALTGGPSQAEYESFEPAGATEMVNMATGDFVYNIPLMDVDGYPINVSYHGGVTMEQEASWVGLGWNLNVGSINRAMRGLPDDFKGDVVTDQINIKDNKTYGLKLGRGFELVGYDIASIGASAGLGITYNNYKGLGLEVDIGLNGGVHASYMSNGFNAGAGLGLKISNQDGADFMTNTNMGASISLGLGNSIGASFTQVRNSRLGQTARIRSGSLGEGVSVLGVGHTTGTGSSVNLIQNTAYTPNLEYSTIFSGISGEVHVGVEVFWLNYFGYARGHYFKQELDKKVYFRPAYGYLNLEKAGPDAMMDFNRDKDGAYYLECPKLPFATLTNDVFNANAQGLNELYRPYRNDFGHVHDAMTTGGGTANDIGYELNIGNLVGIGSNFFGITTANTSGDWLSAAANTSNYFNNYEPLNNSNSDFDNHYFKAIDELHTEDMTFYNSIGKDQIASFDVGIVSTSGGTNGYLNSVFNGPATGSYAGQKKTNKEPKNNGFSYLTVKEAQEITVTNNSSTVANRKKIVNHPVSTFNYTSTGDIDPDGANTSFLNKDFGKTGIEHHISEINVTKDDGARYQYGIAVYNNQLREEVFNVNGNTITNNDLVNYNFGIDNSTGNSRGDDNFFNKKEIPAFAHSYLLTNLYSSDYVDITGNGPTNDDYGDYTKFNYSQTSGSYLWRTPVDAAPLQALYEPQLRARTGDDKGMVASGIKEIWYVHSIETKNYVAEFYLSDRDDAKGCDFGGNILTNSNNTLKRLDKIVLRSKHDLTTPIKTVHFEYNYELCQNTPNSFSASKGKLTLKKVYFTYGVSDKAVFNPYEFIYADANHDGTIDANLNPDYNRRWLDRWGYYQDNGAMYGQYSSDFPYTIQDKGTADANASAWCLSSIITPSKSKMDIFYESDSYTYIQNKTPGQMVHIEGFSNNNPGSGSNLTNINTQLYSSSNPYLPNNWMVVNLSKMSGGGLEAANQSAADNVFRTKILPAMSQNGKDQLYFRALVQIGPNSNQEEIIPGYAEFDRNSCFTMTHQSTTLPNGNTLYKYACIKLKDMNIDDVSNMAGSDNCNPISKAAWQITRMLHPKIAYPGSEPGNNAINAIVGLWGALTEVFTFQQKNKRLRKKLYSRLMSITSPSIIRLNIDPDKEKFGGGHRVSRIEIKDNWNAMVPSESSTVYGQTYDYTKLENGKTRSSGVASYEPLLGGEENTLREPIDYSVARVAAPDDAHFVERPIGESFYPPATIIYSKITVRNLDRKDGSGNPITQNIGRTEYEFYTSRDFPIYSAMNGMDAEIVTPDPVGDLFNSTIQTAAYLSQGFLLKLNNMHGKLKSVLTFQEGNNNPISGTRYYYKVNNLNQLENKIDVVGENGLIQSNVLIGQHVEAVSDLRQSQTTTIGQNHHDNLNISVLPFIPIPVPLPSTFYSSYTEERDFQSATFNKVITQNGLLVKVENINDYSTSTTENLLWDAKTHDVVLTRTTTNYKDYDYNYNLPAHWVYKGMGGTYKNQGLYFKNVVTQSTGQITLTNGLLTAGDEVALIYTDPSTHAIKSIYKDHLWLKDISTTNTPILQLIDRQGNVCSTSGTNVFVTPNAPSGANNFVLKVIRSGYRNHLDESAEGILYTANPVQGSAITSTANIIDAGATEFTENWELPCNNTLICGSAFSTTNPYILNSKGNWREVRNYNYLTERTEKDAVSNAFDIRKDGTFKDYKPFFKYAAPYWLSVYDNTRPDYVSAQPFSNWIMTGEILKVTPMGNMVEAKDAINRYSAALFRYNQTLKTANAVNARQREIGNDNFEDYGFPNFCREKHMNFASSLIPGIVQISNTQAHTGRHSMSLAPGASIFMETGISQPDCETVYGTNNTVLLPASTGTNSSNGNGTARGFPPITTNCQTCIGRFSPMANWPIPQKYTFSIWFKESVLNANGTYAAPSCKLIITGVSNGVLTPTNKSAIISGWQKFDYEFTIPANQPAAGLVVEIQNTSTTNTLFVDDYRINHYNASMAAFVYDPKSLRLWAELDDRNFATFYEYDNEGVLVRVKKETERGIMTIKETRNSFKKN